MKHARERATRFSNRLADRITAFSGAMTFVVIHVISLCVVVLRSVAASDFDT